MGLDGLVESGLMDSLDKMGQSSGVLSHSEHSHDGVGASSTDLSVQTNVMGFSSKPLSVNLSVVQTCVKSCFVDAFATLVLGNFTFHAIGLSLGSLISFGSSSS